jgi:glycosyltransferase involved in cell wall biosynthesis
MAGFSAKVKSDERLEMGNPKKQEQIEAAITWYSNGINQATGYGQQSWEVVTRMKRHGIDVAAVSNYGREGSNGTIETPFGKIPEYARGVDLYSNDSTPVAHAHHISNHMGKPNLLMTLADVWILTNPEFDKIPKIASWTPLDHVSIPPGVKKWLEKPNVLPIAMSPFGVEQMSEVGIESTYIPHAIDTHIFKPTETIEGQLTRRFLNVKDDDFLIVVNSANKANRSIHRKAFAELLYGFAMFRKKVPNAYLYIHTEPTGVYGGFHLPRLAAACGLPMDAVLFPNPVDYRYGFEREHLAAIYSAADVVAQLSYGGGFELPIMEAQACGKRVISINWSGPKDLVAEDGYLVSGQLFWDEAQLAWFKIPHIGAILQALENAYDHIKANGSHSEISRKFAKQFDAEKVWLEKWLPFLKEQLK